VRVIRTTAAASPPTVLGATDILDYVVLIVLAMWIAVIVYRSIQRPRIVLTEVADGEWRARRRDVVQYLISIPFLLLLWTASLVFILVVGTNNLSGFEIQAVASAVVIAARLFAHVSPERSHELSKTVPLTLVTLVLISGSVRDFETMGAVLDEFARTELTWPATFTVLWAELLFTALWYWVGVRWLWPKGRNVPGMPRHLPEPEIDGPPRAGAETEA
jgi:hypothetical protein